MALPTGNQQPDPKPLPLLRPLQKTAVLVAALIFGLLVKFITARCRFLSPLEPPRLARESWIRLEGSMKVPRVEETRRRQAQRAAGHYIRRVMGMVRNSSACHPARQEHRCQGQDRKAVSAVQEKIVLARRRLR